MSAKDMRKRNRTMAMIRHEYGSFGLGSRLEIPNPELEMLLFTKYRLFTVYPSTGVLAIVYCLEKFPSAKITIAGFDFLRNQLGHYWEKTLKTGTVHDTRMETRWIRNLTDNSRLEIL
ncbi:hypothetical protein CYMTET_22217 [Cymbomonas tetramitiformis]|uniref:Uncharacterized protein n=1 Tax=Cymbomonas tetramitiformis TaxID=36881 RepID=A0AAE0G0M1_9CHLO|nr:hypothetical protein CYMTET_22217 [Cymbomonas tetramitiformis]